MDLYKEAANMSHLLCPYLQFPYILYNVFYLSSLTIELFRAAGYQLVPINSILVTFCPKVTPVENAIFLSFYTQMRLCVPLCAT